MPASADNSAPPTPCCEACGRPEALQMGHRWLCAECISVAGSCCSEFDTERPRLPVLNAIIESIRDLDEEHDAGTEP